MKWNFAARKLRYGKSRKARLIIMVLLAATGQARGQTDAQSTTGPTPPATVLMEMAEGELEGAAAAAAMATLEEFVPCYYWRHGCGPTALGMIIGYYDSLGWDNLVVGDASTQTTEVNQMIASGGTVGSPWVGNEQHLEDYGLPRDDSGPIQTDAVITAGRTPHDDNCLADFMDTSKSTRANKYGWSWFSDVGSSFVDYINLINPAYNPSAQYYYMGYSPALTWQVLTTEIDAGRPMVLLVDTDGNNDTDHFVTVIGYSDGPPQQYYCYDTWYSTVRNKDFAAMAPGQAWGIYGGWSFILNSMPANMVETPDVVGNIRAEAEKLLVQAGLSATFDSPYGDTPSLDFVVEQDPAEGEMVLAGTAITLTVVTCDFNGDNMVSLPDFAMLAGDWLTCNAAEPPMTNLDLDEGGCVDFDDLLWFAPFFAQSAAATATPAVIGQTQTAAEAILAGAGLNANAIFLHSETAAGDVFNQASQANSETPAGGTVDIYVSLGPEN
ncbi:MAG: PASTA domain-containing protein [Sedimentisphaerales bacterium]|nr:PASTA domain-containing protein [Sedimentisphaerales bacterium]